MPVSINEPGTPAFEPISGAVTPEITSIEPTSCAIGDADFDLVITGNNFTSDTEIYFAGHPEPTTLHEDGTISTGVKPSLWGAPATVHCQVHTGTLISNVVDFEFTAPAEGRSGKRAYDKDELVLNDIEPDSLPVGHDKSFLLTVTGEGFTRDCVIVFDDEEVPTKYISATKLSADVPMASAPDEVDVEVHRGEEMSDVISFAFVAERGTAKRQPARKPRKAEPVHKRPKKKGR
jgi:IPT/TIG domain